MDYKKTETRRSPLKRKPLRNPGESLQEEIHRLLSEEFAPWAFVGIWMVVLAAHEWWRYYLEIPPRPKVMTAAALLVGGYATIKCLQVLRRKRALRLGLEGEKVVGQGLEELRSKGCRIFHDIVGDGFNIDHVVVSTHGIFVIETKTWSKPVRGGGRVAFDGERILVNGIEPDRNPVQQVLALRDWIRDYLLDTTGHRFLVKAVVVLPGWFVEPPKERKQGDLWVLNPKAFPSFLENEPVVLKSEDVALVCSRLIDYMTR